jgi:hypothetical protein
MIRCDRETHRTANLSSITVTDDGGNRCTVTAQGFPTADTLAAFLDTVRSASLATVRQTGRTADGVTVEMRVRVPGPDAADALAGLLASV